MQNAKDTFYEVLRSRLTALNPERTIVVRGVTRPGVLVEENELVTAVHLPDCFRLRWVESQTNADSAMTMVTMQGAIDYETAGTANNGGMDRGRLLAAMDAELTAALNLSPRNTEKNNYSGLADGGTAVAMQTKIWWSEAALSKCENRDDRIGRTATVTVMSYQEGGEL